MKTSIPDPYLQDYIYQTVRKSLLERLLYGRCREVGYLPELLARYGLNFATDRFALLALSLPASAHVSQREKSELPPEINIHQVASDSLRELPDWDSYPILTDRFYCALLCAKSRHPRSAYEVGRCLADVLQNILPVSVAVSLEKHGMGGINDAYYEVTEVLGTIDMRALEGVVVSYSELDAYTYQDMDTTFERDRKLINFVLEGDRENACQQLNLIESSSSVSGHNTLMMEKRHLMGVINQMTAEITASGDEAYMSELQAFQCIMDAPALDQLMTQYRNLILRLCDYYQEKQAPISVSRVSMIADYINSHYQDPDLSMDQISGIYKISPSYLSRIFKRETGTGVLAYLQQKRVGHARRLLTDTTLTVHEIALRAGFLNDRTFTRTFKALVGTTPAKYRQERRE